MTKSYNNNKLTVVSVEVGLVHPEAGNAMTTWQVYLLRCSDLSLYCGTTTDLERRVQEHNQGVGSRYTKSRPPVRLVWSSRKLSKSAAFSEEYRIKRLSKVLKERMVNEGLQETEIKNEETIQDGNTLNSFEFVQFTL